MNLIGGIETTALPEIGLTGLGSAREGMGTHMSRTGSPIGNILNYILEQQKVNNFKACLAAEVLLVV
jgi:hypothetical protein